MSYVDAFIHEAREMKGWEFCDGGQGGGCRVDCLHVVILAAKSAGYLPADFKAPDYPSVVDPKLWDHFDLWFDRVPPETRREGDVLILYEVVPPILIGKMKPQPRHCGILTTQDGRPYWLGVAINTTYIPRVVESPFREKKLQERIFRVYRIRTTPPSITGAVSCLPS